MSGTVRIAKYLVKFGFAFRARSRLMLCHSHPLELRMSQVTITIHKDVLDGVTFRFAAMDGQTCRRISTVDQSHQNVLTSNPGSRVMSSYSGKVYVHNTTSVLRFDVASTLLDYILQIDSICSSYNNLLFSVLSDGSKYVYTVVNDGHVCIIVSGSSQVTPISLPNALMTLRFAVCCCCNSVCTVVWGASSCE